MGGKGLKMVNLASYDLWTTPYIYWIVNWTCRIEPVRWIWYSSSPQQIVKWWSPYICIWSPVTWNRNLIKIFPLIFRAKLMQIDAYRYHIVNFPKIWSTCTNMHSHMDQNRRSTQTRMGTSPNPSRGLGLAISFCWMTWTWDLPSDFVAWLGLGTCHQFFTRLKTWTGTCHQILTPQITHFQYEL